MSLEIWKPVVGFEGRYEVSNAGRVMSLRSGVVLKLNKQTGGYLIAHLYRDGKRTARTVHSMVLTAFVGPRPAGAECLHGDHDRTNNALSNLRWGTRRENEDDKMRAGRVIRGEKSTSAKLTRADVFEIRAAVGTPQQELADRFGCTFSNISAIQLGKSWRHV